MTVAMTSTVGYMKRDTSLIRYELRRTHDIACSHSLQCVGIVLMLFDVYEKDQIMDPLAGRLTPN